MKHFYVTTNYIVSRNGCRPAKNKNEEGMKANYINKN